jgi:sulfite reductase (NADPH) hemoprotein beta-component
LQERGVELDARRGRDAVPASSSRRRSRIEFTTTSDIARLAQGASMGSNFLALFVETGRIKDMDGQHEDRAARESPGKFPAIEFRLTANQNVILANVQRR